MSKERDASKRSKIEGSEQCKMPGEDELKRALKDVDKAWSSVLKTSIDVEKILLDMKGTCGGYPFPETTAELTDLKDISAVRKSLEWIDKTMRDKIMAKLHDISTALRHSKIKVD
jgi:hypothetical protein